MHDAVPSSTLPDHPATTRCVSGGGCGARNRAAAILRGWSVGPLSSFRTGSGSRATLLTVETVPCPHCEAPLKPTATYCLACNTPVVPETSRLSVGEPTQVKIGRPIVGITIIAVAVLLVLGAGVGTFAFIHHRRAATTNQATKDVRRATALIVNAQAGKKSACRRMQKVMAGPVELLQAQCQQVLGHDPGVQLDKIAVDQLQLGGKTGTARVRSTVTDKAGTRNLDQVVHLVEVGKLWRLQWDGRPTV